MGTMARMTLSLVMDRVVETLSAVTPESVWEWFTGWPLMVLVTLVAAFVVRWLLNRSIDRVVSVALAKADARREKQGGRASRVLNSATGLAHERARQRTLTMGSLLRNIVTIAVAIITTLTILQTVGIKLAPVLATAGVGGVALAFGAQSLVKDFLSGIFMIFEDQYGVGDVIDTGEAVGTVEEVSLRVTRLRDGTGVVWYVRNGEIIRIGNKSQGWSTALVDIPVSYAENLERVIPLMRDVLHGLDADPAWKDKLLDEPQVLGVESVSGTTVTVRVLAKTAPMEQFGVSREIRERVKAAFDAAGVKGPPMAPFAPPTA